MVKFVASTILCLTLLETATLPLQAAATTYRRRARRKTAKRVGTGAVGGAVVGGVVGGPAGAAVGAAAGAGAGAAYDHHKKKQGQ